ncbi:MAG: HAMP domain-containing histidine kinase [Leptospirales bacterium]|nr:HAMP domain-containing histidine kinase [Leptospirales bacterium]
MSEISANEQLPALPDSGASLGVAELPALAAGLVHEVKNPLAAIHMHLQLLEGYLDEIGDVESRQRAQQKITLIKREISGLNKTLHDFISLLRPQAREKDIHVDLNQLLQEVIALIEPQALREGIELRFQGGETPLLSNVDSSFIKQIALNLVLNAIQALQESDLPMEERRIAVRTAAAPGGALLRVEDNGPGVPAELQAKIFQPFFSTKQGKGSGLGLALVQKMAAELGGRVSLDSSAGRGARFEVFLPADGARPQLKAPNPGD